MTERVHEKQTLREILNDKTDLYKFTYDERSYENQIDYAIDEVYKGVKLWLKTQYMRTKEGAIIHSNYNNAIQDCLEKLT